MFYELPPPEVRLPQAAPWKADYRPLVNFEPFDPATAIAIGAIAFQSFLELGSPEDELTQLINGAHMIALGEYLGVGTPERFTAYEEAALSFDKYRSLAVGEATYYLWGNDRVRVLNVVQRVLVQCEAVDKQKDVPWQVKDASSDINEMYEGIYYRSIWPQLTAAEREAALARSPVLGSERPRPY